MYQEGVAVLASFAAAAYDVRTRRIPNLLSLGLVPFGVVLAGLEGGTFAALTALLLATSIIVFGSVLHANGWFGGGDIKLMAGCAACAGLQYISDLFLFTAVAGGVIALCVALRQRRLLGSFRSISTMLVLRQSRIEEAAANPSSVPYAVAISIGMIAVLIAHSSSLKWFTL